MTKQSEEKDQAIQKWFDTELEEWLIKLDKSIPHNSDPSYTIGTTISYADINLWQLIYDTFDTKYNGVISTILSKCQRIDSITKNVSRNPNLQQWLKDRPVTMF